MVYSRLARRLRARGFNRFGDYLALARARRRRGVGSLRQLADHQPDLVLPRGAPLRRSWPTTCARANAAAVPHLVLRRLDRRGALLAGDHRLRGVLALTPPVRIVASDIDTNVLATAAARRLPGRPRREADARAAAPLLPAGHRRQAGKVRVRPELQKLIDFTPLNLLDARWAVQGDRSTSMFCRNVMIYFDKPTQYADPRSICAAAAARRPAVRRPLRELLPCRRPVPAARQDRLRARLRRAARLPPQSCLPTRRFARTRRAEPATSTGSFEIDAVKVLPGEYYVTTQDMLIVTVLGSCVAACIRDRASRHRRHEPLHAARRRLERGTPASSRRATAPTRWKC